MLQYQNYTQKISCVNKQDTVKSKEVSQKTIG